MKVFIDANLLIYLNTVTNSTMRIMYESFYLDILAKYKAYTDVLVLDELLYVSKKKYKIPYSVTLNFIETIVLPYVRILSLGEEEFCKAADVIAKYNLKPSDALHVGTMLVNGINLIVSEDSEYDKVEGIKRIWLTQE